MNPRNLLKLDKSKATIEEKVATFQAATKQHVAYLSSAADGKGVDRHLFGLKQMLKPGEEIPEIFTDQFSPILKLGTFHHHKFLLSTSNLGVGHKLLMMDLD